MLDTWRYLILNVPHFYTFGKHFLVTKDGICFYDCLFDLWSEERKPVFNTQRRNYPLNKTQYMYIYCVQLRVEEQ